jgi:tetratricopeptide (TPR) repeat protein
MQRLRNWLAGWLAGWYAGGGFNKFLKKQYREAARLFERSLKLDSDSKGTELIYSCLGRCYLALGQLDKALQNLSVAYSLYEKNILAVRSEFQRTQYREFLEAYAYALRETGQFDASQKIVLEAKGLMDRNDRFGVGSGIG